MNSLHFSKIKTTTIWRLVLVFLVTFLFCQEALNAQEKDFVVVLDAGHGGKDPGKVGYKGVREKDIALNIVLEVGRILEKNANIKVVYTRKSDVFIGLKERGRIANKADADLFVSVHCNAHNTQAYGSETWVLGTAANRQNFEVAKAENSVILLEDNYETNYKGFDPNSPESVIGLTLMQEEYLDQSIQLASIIQNGFKNRLNRRDRGVKQNVFVVLHQTYMPSVLIETGFITNRKEGPYLSSKSGQQKFSASISKSILDYKTQLALNSVSGDIAVERDEPDNEGSNSSVYDNVIFKVQIAAGGRKLETASYNFKGIKGVERIKVGRTYKYYIGATNNFDEVERLKEMARSKGYKTAFVVAFRNGERIPIESILEKS